MPFRSLVGHGHVLALLTRAIARDSMPPSLIFAGPDGVGKFTTATALAEVLNCDDPRRESGGPATASGVGPRAASGPIGIDACGACRPCRRIARAARTMREGTPAALDCLRVLLPDDKGSIKVEPVREVIAASAFRPFDGRRRVVVLDSADALEVSAQNALLKVLEEPPPGTVFVLVTSRPDALLPTIRSRCPRLRFGPLAPADIARHLTGACGLPAGEAQALSAQADGSLGHALALAGGTALEAREVAAGVLARVASSGAPAARLAAAQALIARPAGRTERKGAGAVTRSQIADRLEALSSLLRDLQVVSTRANDRWLAHADLARDLARLRAFDGQRCTRAFTAVDRALLALDRNVSHKAVADWLAGEL